MALLCEEHAARVVNFRLLRPAAPGATYEPEALSVRFEAAPGTPLTGGPAGSPRVWSGVHGYSVHYPLRTPAGLLRVKQFLYDWGPSSSLDHAALYDHRPESMRMWPLHDERVAWTGWDHAGRRGLSMLAWGTNVELRELSGEHPEGRLLEIARSLEPVADTPLRPMAERSYWSRWQGYATHMIRTPGYRLPSSLWLWRWPWLQQEHAWTGRFVGLDLAGLRQRGEEAFAPAWRYDSACVFGDPGDPDEVQLLFQQSAGPGHAQLWLRRFANREGSLRRPVAGEWPLLDPFTRRLPVRRHKLVGSRGLEAYVASENLRHGPHDAVWWSGRHGFLLQVSAAVHHDLDHVVELLSALMAEAVAVGDSPAAPTSTS